MNGADGENYNCSTLVSLAQVPLYGQLAIRKMAHVLCMGSLLPAAATFKAVYCVIYSWSLCAGMATVVWVYARTLAYNFATASVYLVAQFICY